MADLVASGRVVAPGAGAVIATLAAPAAGKYRITVDASVSGNAAADTGNLALNVNNAAFESPIPHGVNGENVETHTDEVQLDGTHPVTVTAIGAGTASIEYEATIKATPLKF